MVLLTTGLTVTAGSCAVGTLIAVSTVVLDGGPASTRRPYGIEVLGQDGPQIMPSLPLTAPPAEVRHKVNVAYLAARALTSTAGTGRAAHRNPWPSITTASTDRVVARAIAGPSPIQRAPDLGAVKRALSKHAVGRHATSRRLPSRAHPIGGLPFKVTPPRPTPPEFTPPEPTPPIEPPAVVTPSVTPPPTTAPPTTAPPTTPPETDPTPTTPPTSTPPDGTGTPSGDGAPVPTTPCSGRELRN